MSTRGLLIVKDNQGEVKVAEYISHDAYPSYAGSKLLQMCKRDGFIKSLSLSLKNVGFINDDEDKDPEVDKNEGIDILEFIINESNTRDHTNLENSFNFGRDSLFCEWAYMIDLKENKFVVFQGFNKNFENQDKMFEVEKEDIDPRFPYYGVTRLCEFDLNALPLEGDFYSKIESKYDDLY